MERLCLQISFSENQLQRWVQLYKHAFILDSNHYSQSYKSEERLIALGFREQLSCTSSDSLAKLQQFIDKSNDWLFGFLGYDLKNEIYELESENNDSVGLDDLFFIIPKFIIRIRKDGSKELLIHKSDMEEWHNMQSNKERTKVIPEKQVRLQARISKKDYIRAIDKIQSHIAYGHCYELNFCQEFYAEEVAIEPFETYKQLKKAAKAPFSTFMKLDNKYLLCASPERFLKKEGSKLISQPIKGTAKRGRTKAGDEYLRHQLSCSHKDRAENIMVVDLVRNDLGRCAEIGSIIVEELCQLYTFEHVHQLISTISAEQKSGLNFTDTIRNTFPMGSMTGAPKKRVLELIEKYEQSKRGLYSGSVGYIKPNGDFDFNVVIRSLIFNAELGYLSCHVGGAITAASVPEKEYEECLVKVAGIQEVLTTVEK